MYHDKIKRVYSAPLIKEFKLNQHKKVNDLAFKRKSHISKNNHLNQITKYNNARYNNPLIFQNKDPIINNVTKQKSKSKCDKLRVNTRRRGRPEYYRPKNFDEMKFEFYRKSKYVYIPVDDKPKMGWLQLCIFCYNVTSNTKKIGSDHIYLCNKCNKTKSQERIISKAKKIKHHNF